MGVTRENLSLMLKPGSVIVAIDGKTRDLDWNAELDKAGAGEELALRVQRLKTFVATAEVTGPLGLELLTGTTTFDSFTVGEQLAFTTWNDTCLEGCEILRGDTIVALNGVATPDIKSLRSEFGK